MFEFFKECDEELYEEIINEVEPNMINKTCLPIIQSKIEKIIKKIYKVSGIKVEKNKPNLADFLNHYQFKQYLIDNTLMQEDEINSLWPINRAANSIKHDSVSIEVDTELKGRALLNLFNLCKNYYVFTLGKLVIQEFDVEYVVRLIDGKKEEKPRFIRTISSGNQEIIDALERLEEKLYRSSGYKVREVLFEMGIETGADNEKKMRGKLRKLYEGDIVYTPCGKGSGTYRLSKYRGK